MDPDRLLVADRSERGKLAVTGPQRAWFLDQILTQSFEDIAPGEARTAAMLTVHGRMTSYIEARATEDAILCHYESELRDSFPEALQSYVFATQVELVDVTAEKGLVLVAGPGFDDAVARLPGAPVLHPTPSLGCPAAYLWCERDEVVRVLEELRGRGFADAPEEELERIRILNGVPRWGYEMDTKTFPQEVGIDSHAVQYEKGCYLGQEAMAKIHFRGKVNRRLARLDSPESIPARGDVVIDGATAGRVTSAVGGTALAVVKHTLEPGAVVIVGATQAKVVE